MRYVVTIAMVLVTSVLSSCIAVTVPESRSSGDLHSVSNLAVERILLEGIRAMSAKFKVHANNIANSETPAFKRMRVNLVDLGYNKLWMEPIKPV